MRILAVQDSDWFERGPHQQHHLLERLSLRGHQIRVLDYPILWRKGRCRGKPGQRQHFCDGARYVQGANVEVIRPAIWPLPLLDFLSHWRGMALETQRQCAEFRPDLIIGYGILSDWGAVRCAQRLGLPYVAHLLDALHQLVEPALFRGVARRVEAGNLRHATRTVVINRALRSYAVTLGAAPESTDVVPTGVDCSSAPPEHLRQQLRQQLNIPASATVLLFMGWLYRFSGVLPLAHAVLDSDDDNMRFLAVGDGDCLKDLQQLKSTSPRGHRLVLTGRQPYTSMPGYLAASDVCVLPAENNATMRYIVPIKVYEYLAAGKPVLATELPGLVEEFGRDSGVYFIQDSARMLQEARALLHQFSTEELTRRARATISSNDWSQITDRFENVLRLASGAGGNKLGRQVGQPQANV